MAQNESSPSCRLLLVDDYALIRQGLRARLEEERDFSVVGEASNGQDALRLATDLRPDVILLDVRLPDGSGFSVIPEIKQRLPKVGIIVLTEYEDTPALVHQAIQAGALGYISKLRSFDQLVAALRTVATGSAFFTPEQVSDLLNFISQPTVPPSQIPVALATLSPREREILELAASGRPNRDIAETLYVSESTVRTHLTNIYRKLQVSNRAQASRIALISKRFTAMILTPLVRTQSIAPLTGGTTASQPRPSRGNVGRAETSDPGAARSDPERRDEAG
jgi:two-component system NarL family response regulator